MCRGEQLLLLALLKALPLKSSRLDPHPDQPPEVTGSYATEKLFPLVRKNCCFSSWLFIFSLLLISCPVPKGQCFSSLGEHPL